LPHVLIIEQELLKRCFRSEVKGQGHCVNGGGIHFDGVCDPTQAQF